MYDPRPSSTQTGKTKDGGFVHQPRLQRRRHLPEREPLLGQALELAGVGEPLRRLVKARASRGALELASGMANAHEPDVGGGPEGTPERLAPPPEVLRMMAVETRDSRWKKA